MYVVSSYAHQILIEDGMEVYPIQLDFSQWLNSWHSTSSNSQRIGYFNCNTDSMCTVE